MPTTRTPRWTHLWHRRRSGSFLPPPSSRRHDVVISALLGRLELEAVTARHRVAGPLSVGPAPHPFHHAAPPDPELVQRVYEAARWRQRGRVQVVRGQRQARQVERRQVRLAAPQGVHVQRVGVEEELRRPLLLGRLGREQPGRHRAQLLQDLGHAGRPVSGGGGRTWLLAAPGSRRTCRQVWRVRWTAVSSARTQSGLETGVCTDYQ